VTHRREQNRLRTYGLSAVIAGTLILPPTTSARYKPQPAVDQAAYAANYEGSSPDHQASVQAILTLRHGFEIVPDCRFVSSLPALQIPLYNTADLNVIYHVKEHLALSATGRNLLQPHHKEFAGNNSNAVGIRRSFFGSANWTW
jgi:outer membrane receptor for ferric coprogen and ferric-rhodotorulic acid